MPPTHMLAHHREGGVKDDPHRATHNAELSADKVMEVLPL